QGAHLACRCLARSSKLRHLAGSSLRGNTGPTRCCHDFLRGYVHVCPPACILANSHHVSGSHCGGLSYRFHQHDWQSWWLRRSEGSRKVGYRRKLYTGTDVDSAGTLCRSIHHLDRWSYAAKGSGVRRHSVQGVKARMSRLRQPTCELTQADQSPLRFQPKVQPNPRVTIRSAILRPERDGGPKPKAEYRNLPKSDAGL